MPKWRFPRVRRVKRGTLVKEKSTGNMWVIIDWTHQPYHYVCKDIADGYVRQMMHRTEFIVPKKGKPS